MTHLLDKAEQILSLINLSDSSLQKYNKLKEIIFTKCNLQFKPLIKKHTSTNNNNPNATPTPNIHAFTTPTTPNHNINLTSTSNNLIINSSSRSTNINNSIVSDLSTIAQANASSDNNMAVQSMKVLSYKKTLIIELLLDLFDKQKLENVKLYRNQLKQDIKKFQQMLDNIYSCSFTRQHTPSSFNDSDFDTKLDELKLNDLLSKVDIEVKSFSVNLNMKSSNLNVNDSSFDNIIQTYNKKIDDMKQYHLAEKVEYENKFNELKIKYNPKLDEEYMKLKQHLNEITSSIDAVYDKFSKKKISGFQPEYNNDTNEGKTLNKMNFITCFIEQLFKDNKHLIDKVNDSEMEKQKILTSPYVINTLHKSDVLNDIQQIVMAVPSTVSTPSSQMRTDEVDNMIKLIQQTIK